MKDMESQGKWFGLPRSALHLQQSDHIQGRSKEGLHPSLYGLGLEWPKADTLPHHNQLIEAPLQGSPTGASIWGLFPLGNRDGCTQLAGQQSCHPHSGPRHGEAVYLALTENVDKSADSAGSHNQRDPLSEIRLIGHYQEYRILVISCNTPHLHMQDDKLEWASTPNPIRFTG